MHMQMPHATCPAEGSAGPLAPRRFSQNGAPHDRMVWLEAVEREQGAKGKLVEYTLRWADPAKYRQGKLKGDEAMLRLGEITALSEGVKSEVGKHQEKGLLQSMRAFKGGTSGIKHFDQACCMTILAKERSLDLQAATRMIRRDWLLALRLLGSLRATGIQTLEARKKIHEFVKPKPRARASKPSTSGFANFFRTRAPSSLEAFEKLGEGVASGGGKVANLVRQMSSGANLLASAKGANLLASTKSAKQAGQGGGEAKTGDSGREASVSEPPPAFGKDRGESILDGSGGLASGKI